MDIDFIFESKDLLIDSRSFLINDLAITIDGGKYLIPRNLLGKSFERINLNKRWTNQFVEIVKYEGSKTTHISFGVVILILDKELPAYKWLGLKIRLFDKSEDAEVYCEQYKDLL